MARAGQLFEGYKSLEIFSALYERSALPDQMLTTLWLKLGAVLMLYYKTPMAK